MRISSLSDIGVKRKDNQDNYWCARLKVDGIEVGVMCMCDGMGGLNDGGVASRMVVEAVRDMLTNSIDVESLKRSICEVNSIIRTLGQEKGRMGTTCTVLICEAGKYRILHVGDSRCYLLQDGRLSKLTKDHTVIEKYRQEGKELPPDMKRKYSNTLTKCVGVSDSIYVDSYSGTYRQGDTFIVCTDGFWHTIEKFGLEDDKLNDLDFMIRNCINHGETDNISVGVLRV